MSTLWTEYTMRCGESGGADNFMSFENFVAEQHSDECACQRGGDGECSCHISRDCLTAEDDAEMDRVYAKARADLQNAAIFGQALARIGGAA